MKKPDFYLKKLAEKSLDEWTTEQLKVLIEMAECEIAEWERVKAEAMKYL